MLKQFTILGLLLSLIAGPSVLANVVRSNSSTSQTTSLTIGASTLVGGTSGQVLYDNAGVIGEASGLTITSGNPAFGGVADAANTWKYVSNGIVFEGATADGFETTLDVIDPTGDATWRIPAAAANTYTFDAINLAQTITAQKTFSTAPLISADTSLWFGTVGTSGIGLRTEWTPDGPGLFTGGANSWQLMEVGDATFDFQNGPCGTGACTNPQLIVRDKDQNTTNYQSVGLSGLTGRFTKALTDGVATSVVIIPVPAATSISGEMLYTVHAKDGTNTQTRSGRIIWNGVAEGTTATCVIGTAEELDNTPTGTLTAAITCTSPANNQIQLLINAASSLTETSLDAYVTLITVGAGEPLPQ
jgi:hypothetical protein